MERVGGRLGLEWFANSEVVSLGGLSGLEGFNEGGGIGTSSEAQRQRALASRNLDKWAENHPEEAAKAASLVSPAYLVVWSPALTSRCAGRDHHCQSGQD